MNATHRKMNLQLFAESAEGASPDGAGNQSEAQAGAAVAVQDTSTPAITKTQAELDAMIAAAKSQAQRNALKSHYDALGISQKDAEKLISDLKAQQSGAQGQDMAGNEKYAQLQRERDALADQVRIMREDSVLLAAAREFADPTDALALADRSALKTDESGNVTGAAEVIAALLKAKPHLAGQKGAPPRGGDVNTGARGKAYDGAENYGRRLAQQQNARLERSRKAMEPYMGLSGKQ